MKRILVGKMFGILLVFVMLISTLGGPAWALESDVVGAGYVDVSVERTKGTTDSDPDVAVLDVRTEDEYEPRHIVGAGSVPLSELEQRTGELDEGDTQSSSNGVQAGQGCSCADSRSSTTSTSNNLLGSEIDAVLDADKPVFLLFYADWCHFCQQEKPIIDELEQEYAEQIAFIRVNSEDDPQAMKEFGVTAFPTMFLIFDRSADGEYIYQEFNGFTDRETLNQSSDRAIANGSISEGSGVDSGGTGEKAMTEEQKQELKDMIIWDTQCNFDEALGEGRAEITNDPVKQAGADPVYTCGSCANCTACLTGGDCDPVAPGVQAIAPGDTLRLTVNIGRGNGDFSRPIGANCIDWSATANGVTFNCTLGRSIDGGNNMNDGISLNIVQNAVINNCEVRSFSRYGIILRLSHKNRIDENHVHDNGDDGVRLEDLSNNNEILRNTIANNDQNGVHLILSDWNHINDNPAINENGQDGIRLEHSSNNNEILRNTIANNDQNGVHLILSDWNHINDNPAINENDHDGIRLENASNDNEILRNEISTNRGSGIRLDDSDRNVIRSNEVHHNVYVGISLENNSDFNTIDGNDVFANTEDGIGTISEPGVCPGAHINFNMIINNRVHDNTHEGIDLYCASDNTVRDNDVRDNWLSGIAVGPWHFESNDPADWCTCRPARNIIDNNNVVHNGWRAPAGTPLAGVYLVRSDDNEILSNTITNNNEHGIRLDDSDWNDINDNPAINGNEQDGVRLEAFDGSGSDNNEILRNTINKNKHNGVHLIDSDWNDINDNPAINENDLDGVRLEDLSNNNEILRNTIANNDQNGVHLILSDWNHINDNPAINENDLDGVRLEDLSNNNEILRNTITKNKQNGVHLVFSDSNKINDNRSINENHLDGVRLEDLSNNNEILRNTITNNDQNGVHLSNSHNSTIGDNPAINDNGRDGIRLTSSNQNSIGPALGTIAHNSEHGIYLISSNNNTIESSFNIDDNIVDGIKLAQSTFNGITHNGIEGNGRHGVHFWASQGNTIEINDILGNGGYGVYDHPYAVGAACGQVLPHNTNNLVNNIRACNPAPAIPWQDPHLAHNQWCLDTLEEQEEQEEYEPPPTVTGVSPGSGYQGETLDVIITGTNFAGATLVSFGAGITVNSFNVDSSTQITASITIDQMCAHRPTTIFVITPAGVATLEDGFTVGLKKGCFIATAAYGTPVAEEIDVLRDLRDQYLLTNPVGEALVKLYYQVSPPMAEFIDDHPALKPVVRTGLVPVIAFSTVTANTTPAEKMTAVGLLALVSVALAVWATRRRGRGPEYT